MCIYEGMYEGLHSRKDNDLEHRDQQIFGRVVMLAVIAVGVIFLAAIVLVGPVGKLIHTVKPNKHPTSQVVTTRSARNV